MVVCSSLEHEQTTSTNALPSVLTVVVLSNDRISEMKNGAFSGLEPLKDLYCLHCSQGSCWCLWSTAPGCVKAQDPCRCLWSRLPLEAVKVSKALATTGGQVDFCSLCYLLLGPILVSMGCDAVEDNMWICGLTAARVSVDVHGPCYHHRLCKISMVCAAT